MKYLITGGAGFIGSHLTETLLDAGHRVTVLDDLSTGRLDNLQRVMEDPHFRFVLGSVETSTDLGSLVASADVVYHLAAAVGVELVVREPVRTIETNVHGTEQVLRYAALSDTRVFVASTSEVYGRSTAEKFRETDDLLIGPPTHSRWSYAGSKLLDEFLALAYHRENKMGTVIVRFFNTVGPRQTGRYGMVLPRFVGAALKGEPLSVYGTGEQTRCFAHVNDVVRALVALESTPDSNGQIFNIGTQESISIRSLAERVIALTGSTSPIVNVPYDEAYEPGFEDMLHRMPDTTRLASLTGWKPQNSLEQIILEVKAYLEQNPGS